MTIVRDSTASEPLRRPNWEQITKKADQGKSMREPQPDNYAEWLRAVKRMHKGEHLGQVEPWSPYSVRETYYPGWADGDFGTLLNQLGEAGPLQDD